MKDPGVIAFYSSVRRAANENIKKEVTLCLFEDLLTLYLPVRTFSYVNNKQELHKMASSKSKTTSLLIDIKKHKP